MTSKDNNPKSDKDSTKPDPVSKEKKPAAEKPDVIPPKESIPPALTPSLKTKQEKKSSGLLGVVVFLFLIIAGGLGAGGYYLYQEQMKLHNQNLAKLSQLEAQLSALDTEADLTRQNKQSLDNLNQELQQFKIEMDSTLKAHQSSLSTLDEDVMRLKEKVAVPAQTPSAQPLTPEETGTKVEPLPGEVLPEIRDEESSPSVEAEESDPKQESQKFVEWMENFFAAIWNWFAGLFK